MAQRGRPKAAEGSRVHHIRLSLSAIEHLEELASYHGGIPVSSLVKEIIAEHLRKHPRDADVFNDLKEKAGLAHPERGHGSNKNTQAALSTQLTNRARKAPVKRTPRGIFS
jgi:hypothetical protein